MIFVVGVPLLIYLIKRIDFEKCGQKNRGKENLLFTPEQTQVRFIAATQELPGQHF
jgi:hypothetical protein